MIFNSANRIEGGLRTNGVMKTSFSGQPLISIVTVVLNGAAHLEQTIKSVLDQDYPNIEYIIIDGGSKDGSLDIILQHEKRIDFWLSEADTGIYDAMNKGIELATGKLIGLLNSDDYYEPGALKEIAEAYNLKPETGILYGNSYIIQDDMQLRYKSYASTDHCCGMGFFHPAMFVQKQVYHAIGKYGLNFKLASDYDFLLRALTANVPFTAVDKFIVNYRNSGLSATNPYCSMEEIRKINRRYFGLLSFNHLRFLAMYMKSIFLLVLQYILNPLLGEKRLLKIKKFYTEKFLIKDLD